MARRNIAVVGASAGGLDALTAFVGGLPAGLRGAIFIAMHVPAQGESVLAELLGRSTPLQVRRARHDEIIEAGRIYVAPPDRHLLIVPERIHLTSGPKENGFRPAVDPLFRTAAAAYGAHVIGVVLSGGLDDGTCGLMRIKSTGGVAVAQDPDDAMVPSMPQSAINNLVVDFIAKAAEIGPLIARLMRDDVAEEGNDMAEQRRTPDPAEGTPEALALARPNGPPSGFVCPECGGALWELQQGDLLEYRCHVGHGYTADGLVSEQTEQLDAALWTALRTLEDHADLQRRMAENTRARGLAAIAEQYDELARQTAARAELIRGVVVGARPAESGETVAPPTWRSVP